MLKGEGRIRHPALDGTTCLVVPDVQQSLKHVRFMIEARLYIASLVSWAFVIIVIRQNCQKKLIIVEESDCYVRCTSPREEVTTLPHPISMAFSSLHVLSPLP